MTANKQMDLYSLFIELATRLIKTNAVSSFIVPDSLIGRSNFSKTRAEVICKRTVLNWVHINKVFEDAKVKVASVIYVFRNVNYKEYSFVYEKAENLKQWWAGKSCVVRIRKSMVEQNEFYKVNFTSESGTRILDKLNNNDRFGSILIMWRGEEMGRRSPLILTSPSENHIQLLAGENVHRYEPTTSSRYLKLENVSKHNYDKPKILIRQLGTYINATLDLKGCVTLQAIYNLALENNDISYLKFLLGLLNSKLYDIIYKKESGDKQSFQRIILENIKRLPIPSANFAQRQSVTLLVDKILSAKQANPQANTSELERKIDELVYELYGLSDDEIKIVEGN